MIDRDKPIWQLTAGEFVQLVKEAQTESVIPCTLETTGERYAYGISGIASLFGCSKTTACKIKGSGKIDKAIKQCGRKIIVDKKKALELLK